MPPWHLAEIVLHFFHLFCDLPRDPRRGQGKEEREWWDRVLAREPPNPARFIPLLVLTFIAFFGYFELTSRGKLPFNPQRSLPAPSTAGTSPSASSAPPR